MLCPSEIMAGDDRSRGGSDSRAARASRKASSASSFWPAEARILPFWTSQVSWRGASASTPSMRAIAPGVVAAVEFDLDGEPLQGDEGTHRRHALVEALGGQVEKLHASRPVGVRAGDVVVGCRRRMRGDGQRVLLARLLVAALLHQGLGQRGVPRWALWPRLDIAPQRGFRSDQLPAVEVGQTAQVVDLRIAGGECQRPFQIVQRLIVVTEPAVRLGAFKTVAQGIGSGLDFRIKTSQMLTPVTVAPATFDEDHRQAQPSHYLAP